MGETQPKDLEDDLEVFDHLTIKPAVLLGSWITRDDLDETDYDGSLLKRYYRARVAVADKTKNVVLYQCAFAAGQRYEDTTLFEIEADYGVAITKREVAETEAASIITSVVVTTAWSKFRDLFSLLTSQAAIAVPSLPLEVEIKVVEMKELVEDRDEN